MKTCNKCLTEKPGSEFYKKTENGKTRLTNSCKECEKARQRARTAKNSTVRRKKTEKENTGEIDRGLGGLYCRRLI